MLFNQITDNKIDVRFTTVIGIENKTDKRIVKLSNEDIECKYVILATGKEVRKLNVPLE